jgi:hypothetical protein
MTGHRDTENTEIFKLSLGDGSRMPRSGRSGAAGFAGRLCEPLHQKFSVSPCLRG